MVNWKPITEFLLWKPRIVIFFGCLITLMAVFFGSTMVPVSQQNLNSFGATYSNTTSSVQGQPPYSVYSYLVLNNIKVMFFDMIPVLGVVVLLVSGYNTAMLIQGAAASLHVPASAIAVSLFIFPDSIIEFSAYALAASIPIMLVYALIKHKARHELRFLPKQIALAILLIMTAAFFETVAINPTFSYLSLLGWVLIFAIVYPLRREYKRLSAARYTLRL